MSDLPNPAPGVQPNNTSVGAMPHNAGAVGAAQNSSFDHQTNIVEQVEKIVAQTPNSPFDRAKQIHALKSVYVQANRNTNPEAQ